MPNINLDDVYVLDETGAQVDKVTGLFTKDEDTTSGEKAFAQLNIGTAGSNRNLLDNPWFTIDQTSETSGAATGGTAKDTRDRWRIARCSEYTFNDDWTVTTKWDGTGSGCYLIQYGLLDNTAFYKGKTCTLSFYADGTLYQKTITMPTGTNTRFTLGGVSVNVNDMTNTNRGYEFQFSHSVAAGKTLGPFKLEKGNISTLPNDGPPDYQKELEKCQRVFIRIATSAGMPTGFGVMAAQTQGYLSIPVPVSMREAGTHTASFSGSMSLRGAALSGTITNVAYRNQTKNVVCVSCTISSNIGVNNPVVLQMENGAYIDISARPS